MNLTFIIYLFMFSLLSLVLIRKHILLCLLSLEFIILSLLYLILIYCLLFKYSMYIYLFFMTFYVCEGVLGLSVLVCMIRSHGNDYLNSMFLW
uniref:NADH-ubiquinone oxidoreductase chain 4L n=1 Tax=Idiocerus salicis TaxID=2705176 RepID=A0A6C0AAY6_9HEMI|nr:NADH dehydrogenase subunit 4L [Idiocerus salicis]QHS71303.1 NADH dehydrogenase subunit 4L [Idiocerus salicis]WEP24858.1 NADH dehydrogenase subunit 4L [Idiocerus sp.]